ncbi:hypothetical protein EB169_02765 [archaeon]|jgi:hypothetical protein|nr:hypothetical protein [archaeon]
MIKKSERYAMLQLPKEVHTALKEYCDERGYKMSRFVSNLIKEKIRTTSKVRNILPAEKIKT